MHPENIKAEIKKVHGSVRAFERDKRLGDDTVRDVLRGRPVRRTAEAVCEFLDKPMAKVFPGRFGAAKTQSTSRKRDTHRLSRVSV